MFCHEMSSFYVSSSVMNLRQEFKYLLAVINQNNQDNSATDTRTPNPSLAISSLVIMICHVSKKVKIKLDLPVITKNGIVNDNFLKQLDKLIGQISSHKCLDGDGNVLGVLGLSQSRLDDLIDEGATVLVLVVEHLGPQIHITAPH